ncbi:MAG: T9SS type A sorting domain-containing protein [Saprospiraceae bacterium]|nr:T9SS type A sorting domain-containing protein [Saprospiraceae bacterium]MBK6565692.1 T9SS type A sorting domain-containing protein [Saprospiraceae bacterium]
MKTFIKIVFVFCISAQFISGQSSQNYWSLLQTKSKLQENWQIKPKEYFQVSLDFAGLYQEVISSSLHHITLDIPSPEGKFHSFQLAQTPVLHPNTSEKFPGFFSYYGHDTQNNNQLIAMSVSPFGVNCMVITEDGKTYYVDPPSLHDRNNYLVYYKKDLDGKDKRFFCKQPEDHIEIDEEIIKSAVIQNRTGDCKLHTFRLALACTGEYANFHGGTKEKVLAAYNTGVTRINMVYRREAGLFFKLVDNVDKLIFLNANSDPYTNDDTSVMLGENQTTVDQIIGKTNYDIGHVFGTGEGGIASLGSVCSNNRKAQGVTGNPNPVGDGFFIDYVAHEMGHQFGANHTQNNNCNRNNTTAVEPGSGSTIMGYAGICPPDVQNKSNDYFHGISLSEISDFIQNRPTCGVIEVVGNTRPTLSIEKSTYTIPASTSFFLKGNGQDTENDILTYCWEQMNNQVAQMPPRATSTTGPMFRSISPSTSPIRYFPDLKNKYGQWEVLPSVARTMNFRGTVRDNSLSAGCTDEINVTVNTIATSSPFLVIKPNIDDVIWQVGDTAEVTWNVAGTTSPPVSCSFIDIFLSVDGGSSYPILLAKAVPNNGVAKVIVPNHPSKTARVMVTGSDNIFFDVSNLNFKIESSINYVPDFVSVEVCSDSINVPFNLSSGIMGFSHNVTFEVLEFPAGFTFQFPQNITNLPARDSFKIFLTEQVNDGKYPIIYQINDTPYSFTDTIVLIVRRDQHQSLQLYNPANGQQFSGANTLTYLQWQEDPVQNYILQISTSPSFVDSVTLQFVTVKNDFRFFAAKKLYFWRVKSITSCFDIPWSPTFVFNHDTRVLYTKDFLRNNTLIVNKSQLKNISKSHLDIDYEDVKPFVYILIQEPNSGTLKTMINGNTTIINPGDIFTTEDIISGRLFYEHSGDEETTDSFVFMIGNDTQWSSPKTFSIQILQSSEFKGWVEIQNDIRCAGEETILNCFFENGNGPFEYSLVNENNFKAVSDQKIILPAGEYQFVFRDANQIETVSNKIKVSQPDLLINQTVVNNYDIMINSTGGAGFTRQYSFDGNVFGNDNILPMAQNNNYRTVVRDVNNCLAFDTVALFIPELFIDSISYLENLLCSDDSTDLIFFVSGGIPPYVYVINNIAYTASDIKVSSGLNKAEIKDAGGKTIKTDVEIFSPDPLITNVASNRRNVFYSSIGGNPPYEYSLNSGPFSLDTFTFDLPNGDYVLQTKDQNGCLSEITFTISILESLNISIEKPLCFGFPGKITVIPDNGTPPFLYSYNENIPGSANIFTGLPAGVYTIKVKDALQDSLMQLVEITQPDSLKMEFEVRKDTFNILASGGTPPYTYSVDGGFVYVTVSEFTNVPKGIYTIRVKDSNNCITTNDVEIIYSYVENEGKSFELTVYPNPVSEKLIVASKDFSITHNDISITDINGRTIVCQIDEQDKNKSQLSVAHLTPGMYVLIIKNKTKIYHTKFIKI